LRVSFLSRPGCHLCDDALSELRVHLAARDPGQATIEIEVVNVEENDDLHRKYLERIPVIRIGGETISEFIFDPEEFDAAVARHGQGPG
jgi:hypothetical protein